MGIWWIWYAILIVIGIIFVLISGKLDKKFNGNNKLKKVILVFSIAVILISIIGIIAYVIGNETEDINNNEITNYLEEDNQNNMSATINAVVMNVNENSLSVMEIQDGNASENLYSVSFTEEGKIGFSEGQEVLIYFDGIVASSYPMQIHNVGKIEITKDQTDITIPENILRYYNNSKENVDINVSEITNRGITINITDTNEIPYEYSNDYVIYKETVNESYTGEGEYIGENTGNSTAGYTGTGSEYIWDELEKNPDIKIEDKIDDSIYNLPNMTEEDNYHVTGKKIDWTNLYGELDNGNYRLVFSNNGSSSIIIEFSVNNSDAEIISQEINV